MASATMTAAQTADVQTAPAMAGMDDAKLFEWVGPEDESSINGAHAPKRNFWHGVWTRLVHDRAAFVCLIALVVMILMAIFVPMVSPYSISDQDFTQCNLGFMENGHIFGTDKLGRDLFVRLCFGMRVSFIIALAAVVVSLVFGAAYGGISGYFGGMVDNVMMRVLEVISCIPSMIMVILLLMVLKPGVSTIILAYALVGWTGMARLVRGEVLKLKTREYVLASRVLGASPSRVILRDLLPNTVSIILVELTMCIPGAILMEGFLSYCGLGVQIPLSSLGSLVTDGIKDFQGNPIVLIAPSIFLCLVMFIFNTLGDSLRDILDPTLGRQ